jgi:hypothetical protein
MVGLLLPRCPEDAAAVLAAALGGRELACDWTRRLADALEDR